MTEDRRTVTLPHAGYLNSRTLTMLSISNDAAAVRQGTRELYLNRFSLPLYTECGGRLNVFAQQDRRQQRRAVAAAASARGQIWSSSGGANGGRPSSARSNASSSTSSRFVPSRPTSARVVGAGSSGRPVSARSATSVDVEPQVPEPQLQPPAAAVMRRRSPPRSPAGSPQQLREASLCASRVTDTLSALGDVDEMDIADVIAKSRDRTGIVLADRAARTIIADAASRVVFVPPKGAAMTDPALRPQREQRPAVLLKTDHLQAQRGVLSRRTAFTLIELMVFGLVIARWKRPLRRRRANAEQTAMLLQVQKEARTTQRHKAKNNAVAAAASSTCAEMIEGGFSKSRSPSNEIAAAPAASKRGGTNNDFGSATRLHLSMVRETTTEEEAVEQLIWFADAPGSKDGNADKGVSCGLRMSRREQDKHQQLAMTILTDEAKDTFLAARKHKIGTRSATTTMSRSQRDMAASSSSSFVQAAVIDAPAAASSRPTTQESRMRLHFGADFQSAAGNAPPQSQRVGSAATTTAVAAAAMLPPPPRIPTAPSTARAAPRCRPGTAATDFSVRTAPGRIAMPMTAAARTLLPSAVSLARATSAQLKRRLLAEQSKLPQHEGDAAAMTVAPVAADAREDEVEDDDGIIQDDGASGTSDDVDVAAQSPGSASASLGDVFFMRSPPPPSNNRSSAAAAAARPAPLVFGSTQFRPATAPAAAGVGAALLPREQSGRAVVQILSPKKTLAADAEHEQRRQRVDYYGASDGSNVSGDDESGDDRAQPARSKPLSRQGSGLLRRKASSLLFQPNASNLATAPGLVLFTAYDAAPHTRSLNGASAAAALQPYSYFAPAASFLSTVTNPAALPKSCFFDERDIVAAIPPLLPVASSSLSAAATAGGSGNHPGSALAVEGLSMSMSMSASSRQQQQQQKQRQKQAQLQQERAAIPTGAARSTANPAAERAQLRQFVRDFRAQRFAGDERSARAVQSRCLDRRSVQTRRDAFLSAAVDRVGPESRFKSPAGALQVVLRGGQAFSDHLLLRAALSKELASRRRWFADTVSVLREVTGFSCRVPRLLLDVVGPAMLPRSAYAAARRGATTADAVLSAARAQFAVWQQQEERLCAQLDGIASILDADADEDEGDDDEGAGASGGRSAMSRRSPDPAAPRVDAGDAYAQEQHQHEELLTQRKSEKASRPQFSAATALWAEAMRVFVLLPQQEQEQKGATGGADDEHALSIRDEDTNHDADSEHPSWTASNSNNRNASAEQEQRNKQRAKERALPVLSADNFRARVFDAISDRDVLFPCVQLMVRMAARGFDVTFAQLREMFEDAHVHFHVSQADTGI